MMRNVEVWSLVLLCGAIPGLCAGILLGIFIGRRMPRG